MGVTGVVIDGKCQTAEFIGESEDTLKEEFPQITKVKFLNDVEAMAYGILYSDKGKNLLSPNEY